MGLPVALISPLVVLALLAVAAMLIRLPLRLLGRWLQRGGERLEHRLPADEGDGRLITDEPPSKPRDPFDRR